MKLILVRHGESEANAKNLLQGKEEGKLTQKGIEQAKKTGDGLKISNKIDMIFCSPLNRCVETLENILSKYPVDAQIFMSELLIERDFGDYNGIDEKIIDWTDFDEDNEKNTKIGLESLPNLRKRLVSFLEELKREDENSTILVVTHGEVIKMMVSILSGKKFEETEVENASPLFFDEFN